MKLFKQMCSQMLVAGWILTASWTARAGGLEDGTTAVTEFRDWFVVFIGLCAGAFLLYRGVMAWANKIQWIDFGMDIAKVAVTGGAIVLAAWAYSVFA